MPGADRALPGIRCQGGGRSDGSGVHFPAPVPDLTIDSVARLHLEFRSVVGDLKTEVCVFVTQSVVLKKKSRCPLHVTRLKFNLV